MQGPCSRRCALIRRPETLTSASPRATWNTETKGLKESITYAKDALATDPVTPDQPGTP